MKQNATAEVLDQKPPSDPDAELMVLRELILKPDLIRTEDLSTDLFYEQAHVEIFRTIALLHEERQPTDLTHVWQRLHDEAKYDAIGGKAKIEAILTGDRLPSKFAVYLETLREKLTKRKLARLGENLLQNVHNGQSASEIIQWASERIQAAGKIVQPDSDAIAYNRITATELATASYDIRFHVNGALVVGQPQGLFGSKKTLKTSVMLDQAVSLASGRPWLGYFHVDQTARVAVFSGESGMATIQETCLRICQAADVDLATLPIVFSDTLPQFGSLPHMDALEKWLVAEGAEVAYFDPAYLALLTAGNEGSIFAMGALLRSVSELCQRIGVTPILLHHTRSTIANPFTPGDLDDASWAGFAEFVRSWTILNRREKYQPGSGLHKLWLTIGGSVGHSGLWGVDVFEGVYSGPGSRVWDVTVHKADDLRQEQQDAQSKAKAEQADAKLEQTKREILSAMLKLPDQTGTISDIRARTGRNGQAFSLAFAALTSSGDLQTVELTKGNNRTYEGYKLVVTE